MKRIATTNREIDKFGAGKDGFRAAVPGVSDPTYLSAQFMNGVQESLVRVIEAAAMELSDDPDLFTSALTKLIATSAAGGKTGLAAPSGSTLVGDAGLYSGTSAPYLKTVSDMLNGAVVSSDRFVDSSKLAAIRNRTSNYNAAPDLNRAMYAVAYESLAGRIFITPGLYRTDDALQMGYGTDFRQLEVMGAGSGYRGEPTFGGTIIQPTFSDRPAVVVQGGRRVKLGGLTLIGLGKNYISSRDLGGETSVVDDTGLAAWIDPALNANANSRYAPYAGIAVDPYVGVAPAPAYPAVAYPAALGAIAQYGKARTDTLMVDDCYISGFVVGAVVQPCNDDGNGDFVSFSRTLFEYNAYGVSVGNSQSRNVNLDTVGFRNVHTCLTNNKHGRQIGKFGGHIRGSHFDRVNQIFDLDGGQCGPMVFDGCYGEMIWRIGVQSAPTRQYPISFNGGEFNMANHPAIRGVPAKIAQGLVTMTGGSINIPTMNCADGIEFDGTKVETYDTSNIVPSAARALAQQGTCGIMPLAAALALDPTSDIGYVVSAGTARRAIPTSNSLGRNTPFNRVARLMRFGDNSASLPAQPVPFGWSGVRGKASVPGTFAGVTGTLDFTTSYAAIFPFGISAGDVIQDDQTGTMLLVESMAGAIATVTAQNNYYNPGGGNVLRTAMSLVAGTWYVFSSRVYGTTSPNYGTTTVGSAVITSTGRADGYAGFLAGDIAVGDYLWQHDFLTKYFPAGVKITAFDTAARTITLSANATKAGVDIPMNVWVRA